MTRRDRYAAARVFGTVAAALVVAGCATKGDMRSVRLELQALAARQDSFIAELRRETRSTQDTVRQQADQLFDFRGELYQHTLMTPMFTPTNNPYGAPRVVLAAVGPKMTEVAGEVAVSSDTSGLKFELS